jgi:hypothetical protein
MEAKERQTELYAKQDAKLNSVEKKKKTAAFQQCINNTWKDNMDPEMAEYIEDDCDFNFPKIYLMLYF